MLGHKPPVDFKLTTEKHDSKQWYGDVKHKYLCEAPSFVILVFCLMFMRCLRFALLHSRISHCWIIRCHYDLNTTSLSSHAIHEVRDSRLYIWVHLSLFPRLPLKGSPRPIPRGSFKTPQNKQCVARPFTADTRMHSPGKAPSALGGPFSGNKGLAIGQSGYPIGPSGVIGLSGM